MDTMLNNIPFVVVKEFFFKNQADTMINFVKKIMGLAKEAYSNVKDALSTLPDKNNQGPEGAKNNGTTLLEEVKKTFVNITLDKAALEIPYTLYCTLRAKQYGNTYIFPYIVDSSTIINSASNASEWGNGETTGSLMDYFKGIVSNIANVAGGIATAITGS